MLNSTNLFKRVIRFFDKLEDKVRGTLSKYPIVYSIIGGVAIVLFWRGVWDTADQIKFLTGPVSIVISVITLLITGLFASFFVGDQIIISGLKKDKKIIDKTETEIETEMVSIAEVRRELHKIGTVLEKLEEEEHKHHHPDQKSVKS